MEADIIVVGAGIAGASAAAMIARDASVILLEGESSPGYHATGRSAAYFAPAYGNAVVRAVTAASASFFHDPPAGFTEAELLRPRASLFIASADQHGLVETMLADSPNLQRINIESMRERVPILNPERLSCGLLDETGGDLDVDALLQGYLRQFKSAGGRVMVNTRIGEMSFGDGKWCCRANGENFSAPIVVNAAGAWADEVAALAGLGRLGLVPKKRTALLVDAPTGVDICDWPLVIDIEEQFYFKPEAGAVLISPADETPVAPADVGPDEMDVAIAIDRVMAVTTLDVRRVNHRWAGLRTFAPDKTFVAGFDPRCNGFFWLAGQGGYGVQSAPGMSRLAAQLITGSELTDPLLASVVSAVAPDRLI